MKCLTKITRIVALLIVGVLINLNANAQSFITNGLVAYYPFNGNANDVTGNGNNGNLGSGIGFASNRFGTPQASIFFTNGVAGEMTTTIQQPASDVFTIALWFNLPNSKTNQKALIAMTDTQSGANVKYDKALLVERAINSTVNNLIFYLHPGNPVYLPTQGNVDDGQWHFAVATLSSQGMMLYLDGNLVGTNSNTSSQGFAGYWRITPSQGYVDDVRIYNRALPQSEVAQLYAIESAPIISIQKAVYLTSNNLWTGSNYIVQASTDLINWTNQGSVFTATTNYWHSTNYWDVVDWNHLFFRVLLVGPPPEIR